MVDGSYIYAYYGFKQTYNWGGTTLYQFKKRHFHKVVPPSYKLGYNPH